MAVSRDIGSGSVTKREKWCAAVSIWCTMVQGKGGIMLLACCHVGVRDEQG
jgi:hypothetical protein